MARTLLGWMALPLALLLSIAACARRPPAGRSDALVLVVIDTMRGDHLGCAGYVPAHTPHLDSLAASGVRFADAVTAVPITLPAVSSLMTGRLPFHHGVRDNIRIASRTLGRGADSLDTFALRKAETTLAERCHRAGWRTAAIVASAVLSRDRGLGQGFETYDDQFGGEYPVYDPVSRSSASEYAATRRRADTVTDLAIERLESFGRSPFFLFVHYFDVHARYDPPPAYAALHPGRPYDGEISFVDAEVGRLLEAVRQRRPNALVVVTADHGEGLGEHGEPEHGFLLHRGTLHVPLMAAGPGLPHGLVRRDPVSLIDVEPTIAAWFGLPAADSARDGRALRWDAPDTARVAFYAETMRTLLSYHWSELRALRLGKWKLIAGPTNELYDVLNDPGERTPVTSPAVEAMLMRTLNDMTRGETRAQVLASTRDDPDPKRERLLKSLGYIAESTPREDRAYPDPKQALPEWLTFQEAKDLYREGRQLVQSGRFQDGLDRLEEAITKHPNFAEAHYARGFARMELGDSAGFWRDVETAHRLDPDHIPSLVWLARRDERIGRQERALERWKALLSSSKATVAANPLALLAETNPSRGNVEKVLGARRRAAERRPDDSEAQLDLAITLMRCGRMDAARACFARYLELSASDPEAASLRRLIREGIR